MVQNLIKIDGKTWSWYVFVVFITFAKIRYQTMIMVLEGQKYSKSSSIDGPTEKHMIRSPVFLFSSNQAFEIRSF